MKSNGALGQLTRPLPGRQRVRLVRQGLFGLAGIDLRERGGVHDHLRRGLSGVVEHPCDSRGQARLVREVELGAGEREGEREIRRRLDLSNEAAAQLSARTEDRDPSRRLQCLLVRRIGHQPARPSMGVTHVGRISSRLSVSARERARASLSIGWTRTRQRPPSRRAGRTSTGYSSRSASASRRAARRSEKAPT